MDVPRSAKEFLIEGFKFVTRYPFLKWSYFSDKPIFVKPRTVNLGLTDRCNYRCKMCWAVADDLKPRKELSFKDIKKIVDSMAEMSIPFLGLTGGEPLLRYDLVLEIIKYASKKGIETTMSSNASLLSEERAIELSKAGLRRISISLDSTKKETHDFIRGINVFDKTLLVLEMLKVLREKDKINFAVNINSMVLKQNFNCLVKLAYFVKDLKANLVLQPVNVPALFFEQNKRDRSQYIKSLDNILIKGKDILKLEKVCKELIKFKEEHGVILNLNWQIKNIPNYYRSLLNGKNLVKFPCTAGFDVIDISPNGEIRTCFYYPKLGNVKKDNLSEIWYGDKCNRQRNGIKNCKQPCMLNCYLPLDITPILDDVLLTPFKRIFKNFF